MDLCRWADGATPYFRRIGLVFAAAVGLTSCTWLAPIPKTDDQGFFSPSAAASAPLGAQDSRSIYEQRLACRDRAAPGLASECFAFGLGTMMDRQEARRRELLANAREVVNLQASYNALIYPFGAVAVYEKLRGAPNHSLLLPAVLGSAIYGLLNAGIPERDKQYLQAASELQCTLAWHGQWLYLDSEVNDAAGVPQTLAQIETTLTATLHAFHAKRAVLVTTLKGKPGSGAAAGALERVKSGGGTAGKDTTPQVRQWLGQQGKQAQATVMAVRQLRADMADAALRLSQDADQIRAELQRRVGEKLPALAVPKDVAEFLAAPNRPFATAQSGEDLSGFMDPVASSELLAGLDKASLKAVQVFASDWGAPLFEAWSRAQAWVDRQVARESQLRRATKVLVCANSTLSRMNETLRLPPLPPATAGSGAGSGNGAGAGGSGSGKNPSLPS